MSNAACQTKFYIGHMSKSLVLCKLSQGTMTMLEFLKANSHSFDKWIGRMQKDYDRRNGINERDEEEEQDDPEISMFEDELKGAFGAASKDPTVCKKCLIPPPLNEAYFLSCRHFPFCELCSYEIVTGKTRRQRQCPIASCPQKRTN